MGDRLNVDFSIPLAMFRLDPATLVRANRRLWKSLTPEVLAEDHGLEPHHRWPVFLQTVLSEAVEVRVGEGIAAHCEEVHSGMEEVEFEHGAWKPEHHERLLSMLHEIDQIDAGQLRLVE